MRKRELRDMFVHIKHEYPDAKVVRSGSWLHSLEVFRSLFPPAYNDSRTPMPPPSTYQGNSYWGQFLRRDGTVRKDLETKFFEKLATVDAAHVNDAFPLATYRTEVPIQVFYDFYGISD